MVFKAPYLSKDELRQRAERFLEQHNPNCTIPVPIEFIIESDFAMDIVPVPGLQAGFDVVAFVTKDMSEIRVDEYVYMNRLNRYRFSLAHELAHRILHPDLWKEINFDDIESWKTVIEESIPEREYSFIEFHANLFAGLVLVPSPELREQFMACIELTKQHGLNASDEATGAKDVIESNIARHFEVSRDVVHRRIEADNLWDEIWPTSRNRTMPKRTNDFQKLVTLVQQSLAPEGAKITESHLVDVPGQSEPREIDVLIESKIGLYRIKIAVEAKDEGRKLDSTKFEAIVGKYLIDGGVKIDKIVIVTHRGFYRPVIERAAKLGVELLTLREAEEMDWSQFVPQQLRLESTPSIHEIKISPQIEAISADSILRDGRVICSHGRNFGTPEHFAWFLFSQIVLRNQAETIHDLDAAAEDKPDGSKVRVDFSPDHEHVLRLNGEDHPIQHVSFIVHFEHGKTVNPPAQQIRFAFPPHICRVELEPPIPDVPLKELRTAGRIICRCCGKDHGTINEFARRSMFERFFPSHPQAVKALEDGVKASPEGQVMLTTPWPLNHHVIRYNDHDYEVTTVKIGVHAIAATAQLNCKQYDLESANGEKKLISHLEADVGGKNIQIVIPDGVKSDRLVLRIDSSTRTA